MNILLIYHFFHPDTVVSARLFSDLAEDLTAAGHHVTVFTCNRLIRKPEILSEHETWHEVDIRRFSRPGFRQGSNAGRLINSAVLQVKWLNAFRKHGGEFDAVILGTDPQFGFLMFPWLHRMAPKARLIHWCFDLYPEAVMVDSAKWMQTAGRLIQKLGPWAYRHVDVMADIGECMRKRLDAYGHHGKRVTLTPWALAESAHIAPTDTGMRHELFGDARLGLLYSGTVGKAHDIAPFIQLARECRRRGLSVGFCFAGYGNCYDRQTAEITPEDTNIRLAGFTDEAGLAARLSAADFHLISLRPGWEGIVVPSKFFGALAMGRPVIYSGPAEACIAGWIRQFGLGQSLCETTADDLARLLEETGKLDILRKNAFDTYQREFSRASVVSRWLEVISQ